MGICVGLYVDSAHFQTVNTPYFFSHISIEYLNLCRAGANCEAMNALSYLNFGARAPQDCQTANARPFQYYSNYGALDLQGWCYLPGGECTIL